MPGLAQIILYRGLRGRTDRHETDLPALAPDAKMQNTLPALLHASFLLPARGDLNPILEFCFPLFSKVLSPPIRGVAAIRCKRTSRTVSLIRPFQILGPSSSIWHTYAPQPSSRLPGCSIGIRSGSTFLTARSVDPHSP